MASELVTFSQVVAKAHEGAAGNEDASEGFGKRQTPLTRPEPEFRSVNGRFNEFGVSVDSYICSVHIYRKLS